MSKFIRIRIGLLVMIALVGLLSLARVNLGGPNERHLYDSFDFPTTVELGELKGGQRIKLEKPGASGRVIAQARYAYSTSMGALEVRTVYFASGDGEAYAFATNLLEITDSVSQPPANPAGPLILRHSGNQVTLTTCMLPDGETVTGRKEMELILSNRPVTLRRLVSSATGDRPWIDERYLWTAMTITTSANSSEDTAELLESAWGEWREFWTRSFPRR